MTFFSHVLGDVWPAKAKGKPDLWEVYRIGLGVQYDALKRLDAPQLDPKISVLLDPSSAQQTWEDLYDAEQRLGYFLADGDVKAEAVRRFLEADRLGVASSKALFDRFNAAADDKERRSLYLVLLDDLHFRYVKRALDRKTRKHIAARLNLFGIILIAPMLIWLLLAVLLHWTLGIGQFHTLFVLYFGALGAFLSRMYAFQGSSDQMDYDALTTNFPLWNVIVRVILGVLGAMVIYLLIIGRLLGGELFPKADMTDLWLTQPLSAPTADFAKLLIWSTIAGFSERFIPDQFTSLASKATDNSIKPK